MPPQQTKATSLAAKLGAKGEQAILAHREDETKFDTSGGGLPPGIEDGVAQLTLIGFREVEVTINNKKQKEFIFEAKGVVVSPETFVDAQGNTHNIVGRQTRISEPLYDTPTKSRKTLDDHFAWILNEIRKLDVETKDVTIKNVETVCSAIQEAAPFFEFRTWEIPADPPRMPKPYKGITYKRGLPDYVPGEGSGVTDDTGEANGAVVEASEAPADEVSDTVPFEAPADVVDGDDIEALVAVADSGQETQQVQDAQDRLQALALAAGVDQDLITNADSWDSVAAMFEGGEVATAEGEGEGEDLLAVGSAADEGDEEAITRLTAMAEESGLATTEEYATMSWTQVAEYFSSDTPADEPSIPKKGEMYFFKPPKGAKKIECEVMTVDTKASTCSVKTPTGVVHKNVAFTALSLD